MNQHILGDKKKSNFDDNLADYVNEIFDKMPDVIVPEKKSSNSGSFYVDQFDDRYVLHGVNYDNKLLTVEWSKELLDESRSHTLYDWNILMPSSKFQIPSAELYFASLLALYESKDGCQAELIERVRQMFAKDFENDMMTSSSVTYYSNGKYDGNQKNDVVNHYYGSQNNRKIPVNFTGYSGYVDEENSHIKEQITALLGSEDLELVRNVLNWATGKGQTFLWALNNGTPRGEERVVMFSYSSESTFSIRADCTIGHKTLARGVFVVRENSIVNKLKF
ncbi:hypothetical protein HZA97_03825 [Candidatus Woesearchaeota archaeon]|nr:hypothetical protein [Candidatus Woesearchaeota archaeon]